MSVIVHVYQPVPLKVILLSYDQNYSQPKSTSRSPATSRPQKKQSQSNSEPVNFDPFNTPAPPTTPSSAPGMNSIFSNL